MTFNTIKTIRYMGSKSKLLEFIIPNILENTSSNDVVVDLMAGSYAISYALKPYRKLICNDVQKYSECIGKAIIENQNKVISSKLAFEDIYDDYILNKNFLVKDYFTRIYSNTYFSEEQCSDIDSIMFAISNKTNVYLKSLYTLALMNAMCKVQSTPGHFAQYMPSTNIRIKKLQEMSLYNEFINACEYYSDLYFNDNNNIILCADYRYILENNLLSDAKLIYLDSPYTQEQYSRFYHLLETVVRDDEPELKFKAKYRNDRFKSGFCYKNKVAREFEFIFLYCKIHKKRLVISYSNKGVLGIADMESLAKKYFKNVEIITQEFMHSTQGKGKLPVNEILMICK